MTPHEVRKDILDHAKAIGVSGFHLSLGFNLDTPDAPPCRGVFWPDGFASNSKSVSVKADDWPQLLVALKAKIAESLDERHAGRVHKMAMAIIEICDGGNADVTDRELRLKGFTQQEVDELGGKACEEAWRLGRGPFSIISTGKANAA